MTGLLVSVRSAAEAAAALQCGVQVLDVKEPARGSLGRADAQVLKEVVRLVANRLPVSAALGELAEWWEERVQGSGFRVQESGVSFAKLGLAGCRLWPDWPQRWGRALGLLPSGVGRVAVAYADWETANAPQPDEVLEHGAMLGCRAALMDTHNKTRGGLFDYLSASAVAAWIDHARALRMMTVVAGSLNPNTFSRAIDLGPDLIAVRGAVCRGGREGPLDPRRIEALNELLQANGKKSALCNVTPAALKYGKA